ncbi:MAG: hypothetical protein JXA06_04620 [Bacteroidetes bacterium]|nr:hypothetical protein [Bacteroidota bacterium]
MKRSIVTIVIVIIAAIIAFLLGRNMSVTPPADFPGADKHEITREQADKLIQNNKKDPQIPKIEAGAFKRGILDKILAQRNCDGIRIYYAQTEDSLSTFVLVGIDTSGADLKKGVYADYILPCPPFCNPPH